MRKWNVSNRRQKSAHINNRLCKIDLEVWFRTSAGLPTALILRKCSLTAKTGEGCCR